MFPRPDRRIKVVVGKLKIGQPWVREAAAGAPGTYSCIIEIQNDGDEAERLLGATIEGGGTGILYKLTENGHFTSRPFGEGLVIKPHGSIELPPTEYQFKFGKIAKVLVADTMVNGTLVFEKLHSVPIEFMVEHDDTAPRKTLRYLKLASTNELANDLSLIRRTNEQTRVVRR